MTHSLTRFLAVALASGALLAPPGARAFTVEDGKGNTVPTFDLEEQSRQFSSKPDLNLSTTDKKAIDTPIGTLQFGVGPNSPFGSSFGSGISNANREHYQRMFTPENVQGRR